MKAKIFAWAILIIIAVVIFFGMFASCSIPKEAGCSEKEHKKALQHFNKALDWCPEAVAERAAIMWPPKVYDSTRVEYRPGIPQIDTQWLSIDCDAIVAEALAAAAQGKQPIQDPKNVKLPVVNTKRIDTLNSSSNKQATNTAEVDACRQQLTVLAQNNAQLQASLAGKDQEIKDVNSRLAAANRSKWYGWIACAGLVVLAGAAFILKVKSII